MSVMMQHIDTMHRQNHRREGATLGAAVPRCGFHIQLCKRESNLRKHWADGNPKIAVAGI
jgi:hypothetical protein